MQRTLHISGVRFYFGTLFIAYKVNANERMSKQMGRVNYNKINQNRYGKKNVQTNVYGELDNNKRNIVTYTQRKEIEKIQAVTGKKFTGDSYGEAKDFIKENRSALILVDDAPKAVACVRRDCDNVIKEGWEYYETNLGKHCSEDCWLATATEIIGMELKTYKPKYNGEPEPEAPKHIQLPVGDNLGLDLDEQTVLTLDSPALTTPKAKAKSGAKGVYPHGDGRFRAQWYHKGQQYYVGIYTTVEQAVIAREKFIVEKKKELENTGEVTTYFSPRGESGD